MIPTTEKLPGGTEKLFHKNYYSIIPKVTVSRTPLIIEVYLIV